MKVLFREAPKHNDHLGSHRDGPGRSSADKESCRFSWQKSWLDPQFSHIYFDISWDEVG